MTTRTLLAALGATVIAGNAFAANLADDFDNANNPGNGWTHGFNDTAVGGGNDIANDVAFGRINSGGAPGDRWTGDGTNDASFPPNDLLLVNQGNGGTAGNHWGGGSITWDDGEAYHTWGSTDAGGINGHSGDDTIFSTYTVTTAGLYDIAGTWTENGNSGTAAVEVLVNGSSIGTGSIDLTVANDSATIQSLNVALGVGDTVSFRTLRDSGTVGGSAHLDASVALVPEPTSMALLGLGAMVMTRRRRV